MIRFGWLVVLAAAAAAAVPSAAAAQDLGPLGGCWSETYPGGGFTWTEEGCQVQVDTDAADAMARCMRLTATGDPGSWEYRDCGAVAHAAGIAVAVAGCSEISRTDQDGHHVDESGCGGALAAAGSGARCEATTYDSESPQAGESPGNTFSGDVQRCGGAVGAGDQYVWFECGHGAFEQTGGVTLSEEQTRCDTDAAEGSCYRRADASGGEDWCVVRARLPTGGSCTVTILDPSRPDAARIDEDNSGCS